MKQRQKDGTAPVPNGLAQPGSKHPSRKPYTPPVLVEYGTIAKLTQGSNTQNNDGSNTRKNMAMCL